MITVGHKLKCTCHGKERFIVKNHPRLGLLCAIGVAELQLKANKEPDWEKKCWDNFSLYIRLSYADDQGIVKCFTCNTRRHWRQMQCGHGIGRQHKATWLNPKNNHPQCPRCNGPEEGRKVVYKIAMDKKYGAGTWDLMELSSRSASHYSQFEYKVLAQHYKQEFEKLKLQNKS